METAGQTVSLFPALEALEQRLAKHPVLCLYLPAVLCFFIINITNGTLDRLLESHHLLYGAATTLSANEDKTNRFLWVPVKATVFFLCTGLLGIQLTSPIARFFASSRSKDLRQTALAMLFAFFLTCTILPTSFGRFYARISTDPFNQAPDQLYRRLLMPSLAYLYHLNGVLYTVLFWVIVLVAVLLTKNWLRRNRHELTLLEELSLLTVGSFVASYQFPGYPEMLVYILGLIALFSWQQNGRATNVQVIAFAFALMTHEACAVIVFLPLAILFSSVWLPYAALLGTYVFAVLANFSFKPFVPLHTQATVSETPASFYFKQYPVNVLLGSVFAFKLFWIVFAAGIFLMLRSKRRLALYVVVALAMALASTYIGVDYSRLVAFATLALIPCYLEVSKAMRPGLFKALVLANLVAPSLYVGGNSGILSARGAYEQFSRHVLRIHTNRL